MEIAKTIISQIGNKTLYLIGAKNFVALESGVQFKIGRNAKTVNTIQIMLNGMDTYDIKYYKGIKLISEDNDFYADMLNQSIEKNTGMYTNL